jgi:hypothetical protein
MTRIRKPWRDASEAGNPSTMGQLLALRSASATELREKWRQLFATDPPPFNRSYLIDRLTYRIQELTYGGLSVDTKDRLEKLGERLDGGNKSRRQMRADDRPVVGTKLVREYQGVPYTVIVRKDGYEFEGRPYVSLSAIARHITGTRWNGWSFFGLRSNQRRS